MQNPTSRIKRLLTATNPNKTFTTPESTVSSDPVSDPKSKNTRELLNLSNCYSCDVRIDCTNPREKLYSLESMWRIVLLCKKCSNRVDSSELCPYCFKAVVDLEECFECGECYRSIHKECVKRYGSEFGFSVCVDCWIPDAFCKSVRARKRKVRKMSDEEEVERKVAAAAKASENAVMKAVAAKNAVELAKGVLSVVAGRKVAGGVGDAEWAGLLRRAINSSPRVSRYACLGSSFRRDGASVRCYSRRRAGKKSILMNARALDGRLVCYSRRLGKGCFKNSVSLNAPLMFYSRRCSRSKACLNASLTDEHVCTSFADLKACNCGPDSEKGFDGNNCLQDDVGRMAVKPHGYHLLKYYRIGKGTPRPSFFVKA